MNIGTIKSSNINNEPYFKGSYAEFNGVWKNMLKGGKVVSVDEFLYQKPIILEVSGVGSKIENFLPSKTYITKQKLALIGGEAKEFEKLVTNKSSDLRLFLNKFFVGEFRLTDDKKMLVNNLSEGKAITEMKEIPLKPRFELGETA